MVVRCMRCGRELSNPQSIKRGFGPVCIRQIQADMQTEGWDEETFITTVPLTEKLVCRRTDFDTAQTNVPRLVTVHSPTGFEFGYSGSGPADMALNLVEFVLRREGYEGWKRREGDGEMFDASWWMHQKVKEDIIARIPHEGGTLDYGDIKEKVLGWLEVYEKTVESSDYRGGK